ncbi:hypothetical protein SpCBS45565_g01802 [Spizellomyces sp. 'palustris']|nr:hypothetical protein SpCBS45565_g01802 [Spizellomyces sp. 'palustris']
MYGRIYLATAFWALVLQSAVVQITAIQLSFSAFNETAGDWVAPREGHGMVTLNHSVIALFGGQEDRYMMSNDLFFFYPNMGTQGTWKSINTDLTGPLPPPRYHPALTAAGKSNSILVLHGGMSEDLSALDDVWILDTAKRPMGWQFVNETVGARWGHSLTTVSEDLVVLFGGYDGTSFYNDIRAFNVTTRQWHTPTTLSAKPFARAWHTASWVASQGALIVVGGQGLDWMRLVDVNHIVPKTTEWAAMNVVFPNMAGTETPGPRCEHYAFPYFDSIVLGGGVSNVDPDPRKYRVFKTDHWLYNVTTQTFSHLSIDNVQEIDSNDIVPVARHNDPITSPSVAAKASRVGTSLFVVGGMDKFWLQMDTVAHLSLGSDSCEPGTVYINATKTCEACPPGSFSFTAGATQCQHAPAGYVVKLNGGWEPEACPAGTFTSDTGSVSCVPCPAETYSDSASSTCKACPTGTTTNGQTGAAQCTFVNVVYRQMEVDQTVRLAMTVIAALLATLSAVIGVVAFVQRKSKVFIAASPTFLYLIAVGAVLSYLAVPVRFSVSSLSCMASEWLNHVGFGLLFGSLLFKAYRVGLIFKSKPHKLMSRSPLTDRKLFMYLSILVSVLVCYLIIWTIVSPVRVDSISQTIDISHVDEYLACEQGKLQIGILGVELAILIWGVYVALRMRGTPSAYNEAQYIGLSIYNFLFVCISLEVLQRTVVTGASFILYSVRIFVSVTGVIGLIFGPKLVKVGFNLAGSSVKGSDSDDNSDSEPSASKAFGGPSTILRSGGHPVGMTRSTTSGGAAPNESLARNNAGSTNIGSVVAAGAMKSATISAQEIS